MKKIVLYLLCIILIASIFDRPVQAATPRVMVSDYSVGGEGVKSGEEFDLKITLKNTAAKAVKNIKVTVSAENGEFLPAKGAGTAYVTELAAESEEELAFPMKAVGGLEEKSYKVSIKTEYESTGGMEYAVDEAIFLPVTLEQRVSVTDIQIPDDGIKLGDSLEITAMVNNMGEGLLYNVTAEVSGYNIAAQTSYIGNLESGKSGAVDVVTKATALYKAGQKNTITVSYENARGEAKSEEFIIYSCDATGGINVLEPRYADLEQVKTATSNKEAVKNVVYVVSGIAVVVIFILLMVRRKKRKQAILDEF